MVGETSSKYIVLDAEINPESVAMFNPKATLTDLPTIPDQSYKFETRTFENLWQLINLKEFKVKVLIDINNFDERVQGDLKNRTVRIAHDKLKHKGLKNGN